MAISQNNLEKAILATVAYFDVFDYPLTLVELWKWLFLISDLNFQSSSVNRQSESGNPKVGLAEIKKTLEDSDAVKSLVDKGRGFYFLKGRDHLLDLRQARYNLAEKKFKKALRVAKFIKMIPGVKMIAVCNSLAWSNASKESDIDFFIVTGKQKMWTGRFWSAGFLKLFGLRPKGKNTRDKICLSFFVDEENLDLQKIALAEPDIYLIYWITQIAPIYDAGGVYQKFLDANGWVKKYLPNFFGMDLSEQRQLGRATLPAWLGVGEKIFRRLEILAMPAKLKEAANKDSGVVVTDSMLKFHANDRRAEYKKRWEEKMVKLFQPEADPLSAENG